MLYCKYEKKRTIEDLLVFGLSKVHRFEKYYKDCSKKQHFLNGDNQKNNHKSASQVRFVKLTMRSRQMCDGFLNKKKSGWLP
jgi:hypothetical protein